ncbi:MAG: hypothetical protein IKW67_01980 [Alphaproteobacteria bacterium]|nr:hypothetical protein [Alphaproteobacteria bacterium]
MIDIEQSYARTFGTASGKRVLEHLRQITIERALGPDVSDSQLRFVEGQRSLIHQIESLVSRGRGADYGGK